MAQSINFHKKKNKTNIFPVRTEQASSTKVSLWLYFKFPDSVAPFLSAKRVRVQLRQKHCFYYPIFTEVLQNFGSDNKEKAST